MLIFVLMLWMRLLLLIFDVVDAVVVVDFDVVDVVIIVVFYVVDVVVVVDLMLFWLLMR